MLGDKIQSLRKRKGLSITRLSIITGVSKSYISYIERNKQKNPSLVILLKLSKALEIDLQELVYYMEEKGEKKTIPDKIGNIV
ncbi:helix-turn-helix domain-containing protein [Niallia sp. NCCP-28]|uniref:helix-turn-helix domain-containing protein n=1 Tax=Niallia sp. NCCP-28 TaxID=2934712 RepID=UPI0020863617|nr:helix-turn-helix transcriptional regulator [Niallia sp. NCCP-28]GKU82880.1 hypothetical protein NCCP28_22760 [Niallia sp. NCCP-28]